MSRHKQRVLCWGWVLLVLDRAGTAWHHLLQHGCEGGCPCALQNCPCSRDRDYRPGQHVPCQGSGLSQRLWVLLRCSGFLINCHVL